MNEEQKEQTRKNLKAFIDYYSPVLVSTLRLRAATKKNGFSTVSQQAADLANELDKFLTTLTYLYIEVGGEYEKQA